MTFITYMAEMAAERSVDQCRLDLRDESIGRGELESVTDTSPTAVRNVKFLRPEGTEIERVSNCRVGKFDESSDFRRRFETQTSKSRFLCPEDHGCCRS